MMARTIVALYDDVTMAQHVVNDLTNAGVPRERINLVASDATGEYGKYLQSRPADDHVGAGEGSAFGASVGALTGLLVSLGALVIPGVGPVIAAGPLLAGLTGAVTGAVAGGATGGFVGGLLAMDIPEAEARRYAEGVRRGGTLVSVRALSTEVSRVEEILYRHNPVDIERRASYWRENGWTTFNDADKPYPADDIARDRETYNKFDTEAPTQRSATSTNYRVRSYDSEDRPAKV